MTENQFETIYQTPTPPVYKNASYFRARARQMLKGKWGEAILIGFLALILGAFISGTLDFNLNLDSSVDVSEVGDVSGNLLDGFGWIWDFVLVLAVIAMVTSILYSLFVASPIKLGYQRINLDLVDGNELQVKKLFSYFKTNYLKSVGLNALYTVVTSVIVFIPLLVIVILSFGMVTDLLGQLVYADGTWQYADIDVSVILKSLPLILISVPVLIAASVVSAILSYAYRFSFMVLAEYPHMSPIEAMRVSRTMMKGNKWRLFCLEFSFIGWFILSAIFTFGLGAIVVYPYREAAIAAFYDDIANRSAAKVTEFPSLDPDDYVPEEEKAAEPAPETAPQEEPADRQEEREAEEEEEAPRANPNGGMPFTAALDFPSLDLDDYVVDEDEDKKQ